ncbi:WhiB family transcriptional regulator [Microbacterium sp. A8/3-1]|uniref:WhiB family transcriptional regulator n=1 Tax=Microbacterium sp. A8/3-1 TaxID=3160749 RepID=UPI003313DD61
MTTKVETAWRALQDALATDPPSCEGDERFTAETSEHDAVLRTICARCPVQQQCADFARTAHIYRLWGYFGGVVRRTEPKARDRRRHGSNTDRDRLSETKAG